MRPAVQLGRKGVSWMLLLLKRRQPADTPPAAQAAQSRACGAGAAAQL